jgi:hypothetical protein
VAEREGINRLGSRNHAAASNDLTRKGCQRECIQ